MKIEFKKSDKSEVNIAVPLIYSSGPDAFEYVFKNSRVGAKDFLKYAFKREGGEFSYDNHYSMYLNGKMVGIGSVFDAKKAAKFTNYDAVKIIQFYRLNCFRIIKNGLQIEQILKLPKGNEIVLAHLGVIPEYRGRGLGSKLVHFLMNDVQKSEEGYFVLDVSEENPKAKALYDRLGFEVTKRIESSLRNKYSYVPNHFRMELKVQ